MPEHFEERVMPGGPADRFQVVVLSAHAHALLAGRRADVVALLESEEHVLELVHPGIGEEQGGIVFRDEGAALHPLVAVVFEITKKVFSDLA